MLKIKIPRNAHDFTIELDGEAITSKLSVKSLTLGKIDCENYMTTVLLELYVDDVEIEVDALDLATLKRLEECEAVTTHRERGHG